MTNELDGEQRRVLLDIATIAVHDALVTGRAVVPDANVYEPPLREPRATFVTLERDGDLLGCIGTLEPVRPLVTDVAHNALAAAFADPRLPAVTPRDYAAMSVKVSVLSVPKPMPVSSHADVIAAVRPGVDGLLLEAGRHRSTLLPSVWPKVRDVHEFLDVLWRKAGLTPGAWPAGTTVSRYTTEEFGDAGPRPPIAQARATGWQPARGLLI
jgi:AmmeMemoRadiSam system protein A